MPHSYGEVSISFDLYPQISAATTEATANAVAKIKKTNKKNNSFKILPRVTYYDNLNFIVIIVDVVNY